MAKFIVLHGISVASDHVPQEFGRLTTIGNEFRTGRTYWQVCQCSCGEVKVVRSAELRRRTKSCGCLQRESASTHGKTNSYHFSLWIGMKQRCTNPKNKRFANYGGRGIKVCDRWLGPDGFANFVSDMGERPSPKHSIDRKENDGDYCPDNCRWATDVEQNNNRRCVVFIEHDGKKLSVGAWAKELGMSPGTIWRRIEKGMNTESILAKKDYRFVLGSSAGSIGSRMLSEDLPGSY
jgi:hypothetical protein